jgi:hypothetical protein
MKEPIPSASRHRFAIGLAAALKRWLAALLLTLGGLAVESVHPVQCTLIATTRASTRRLGGREAGCRAFRLSFAQGPRRRGIVAALRTHQPS